jgi:hypothetical protein
MPAVDRGVVLRHGDGPARCDAYGARDVLVWRPSDLWHMHYDGAGDDGWRLCLATSPDGVNWTKLGPVLPLGGPGSADSASASYGVPVSDGAGWHLFYMGTVNAQPPPERVPALPYMTLKARAIGPGGPWTKEPHIVPFAPQPGTYYERCASPGAVLRQGAEWWQLFSAAAGEPLQRTLGIARTSDLNGPWTVDPQPILPPTEQIENSSVYFEQANGTWFLFTNHVGDAQHTDAVWAYWTADPSSWDPTRRAIILDGATCSWSHRVIGLPSVVPDAGRLLVYYDGLAADATSHVGRDVGLAELPLPLTPPA